MEDFVKKSIEVGMKVAEIQRDHWTTYIKSINELLRHKKFLVDHEKSNSGIGTGSMLWFVATKDRYILTIAVGQGNYLRVEDSIDERIVYTKTFESPNTIISSISAVCDSITEIIDSEKRVRDQWIANSIKIGLFEQ